MAAMDGGSRMLAAEDEADPFEGEHEAVAGTDDYGRPMVAIPEWAKIPETQADGKTPFRFPPGRSIGFLRFKAKMTDTPKLGDRSLILWNLSTADERLALKRTRGESGLAIPELARQMVRAIDGHVVDWTGHMGPGNVNALFDQIGYACRQTMSSMFLKMHTMTDEQRIDFFVSCFVVTTAAS